MDVKCQRQPPNELFKLRNALGRLVGVFIRRGRDATFSTTCCFHFESCSSLRLWGPPTHFCLGTFTAESLKNNFGFKLGSEVFSFSFHHRILLSSRWILYHNLVLESGPNFRWQYITLTSLVKYNYELNVSPFRLSSTEH